MRLHPYFDYFQLSAIEGRVDTSSDTFYNRGYGAPSADCRIEERAGAGETSSHGRRVCG